MPPKKTRTKKARVTLTAPTSLDALTSQLAALRRMSTTDLVETFHQVFGVPTKTRNAAYLRKRLARWLEAAFEGHGLSDRAKLQISNLGDTLPLRWREKLILGQKITRTEKRFVDDLSTRDPRLPAVKEKLERVYKGKLHTVTVLPFGFEYDGRTYRSLTAIAKEITGTQWNGFDFFKVGK